MNREWPGNENGPSAAGRHAALSFDKCQMVCPSCGSEMKLIAFITEHDVVDAILRHLVRRDERRVSAPPR